MRKGTILLERPARGGDGDYHEMADQSHLLPKIAQAKGYQLISMTFKRDPYVLYNRFGQAIYQWECGYGPSWQDAYEVCQRLQLL